MAGRRRRRILRTMAGLMPDIEKIRKDEEQQQQQQQHHQLYCCSPSTSFYPLI